VLVLELQRPPHNYFSLAAIDAVAMAFEHSARDIGVRCGVLVAQGRSFCEVPTSTGAAAERRYAAAARLCAIDFPWIAAVHGTAIGVGSRSR
jgi:enoyl-CoA hydratase/carnithine racemase